MATTEELDQIANAAITDGTREELAPTLLPLLRQRDPAAIGLLGAFYLGGCPAFPNNLDKARSFLSLAARLGDASAAHNMGTLFTLLGEPREEVYRWYALSERLGFDRSAAPMRELLREPVNDAD